MAYYQNIKQFIKKVIVLNCALLLFTVIFEKWRKHIDKGEKCGVLFIGLSKAFGSLQYDLLFAKLNSYGFNCKSVILTSYLHDPVQM